MRNICLLVLGLIFSSGALNAQNSVARDWNSMIIEAIRNDFARPTVHARNLFHHAIIAYDGWAAYDPSRDTYFLGDTLHGYECQFLGIDYPADIESARKETISYASFRFIQNRYQNSPDYSNTLALITDYMLLAGYDIQNTSVDYINGGPAELGNYLAQQIRLYGFTDGSNEQNGYANNFYAQVNPPLIMAQPGNPDLLNPNRWQPLTLTQAIDQSGNPVLSTQPHLSPEWGEVDPFALDTTMYNERTRDGQTYKVYFDTCQPTYLNLTDSAEWDSFYKWNHTLVSVWQSHLDPSDGVMWDISPASTGNNTWYPTDSSQYPAFYNLTNGGDPGTGYALNPITGLPYTPQMVPRGDFARVLAEFWADGIDSETPPGHWFEIYHYVLDQPGFEPKWKGLGVDLDQLEYDVKAQLALGGAMHDAAICAWSLKGYYDYLRPVSAIRFMADLGQSTDTLLPNYDPNGIPLLPGYVELVEVGDTLAGTWNEHVGKIKLFTWKGHEYINDPMVDEAGVGWILAERWWPYQRPSFVTPPFAGFVSGHSTFSRAGANIMSYMTGSEYFPGGMGEFVADQDEYLQFEDGPSVPITLQWAKYKDAADQCSLSRIWGGIHPPIDDIQGRFIGEKVGVIAFDMADSIYSIQHPALISTVCSDSLINVADIGSQFTMDFAFNVPMDISIIPGFSLLPVSLSSVVSINQTVWVDSFNCQLVFDVLASSTEIDLTKVRIVNLVSGAGTPLGTYYVSEHFIVDTRKPLMSNANTNFAVITDAAVGQTMQLNFTFDEVCDTSQLATISFESPNLLNPTLTQLPSFWLNDSVFQANYALADFDETVLDITTNVMDVFDSHGNAIDTVSIQEFIEIDTENPQITLAVASDNLLNQADLSSPQFSVVLSFSEAMDTTSIALANLYDQGVPFAATMQNTAQTSWQDSASLNVEFLLFPGTNDLVPLDFMCFSVVDERGNSLIDSNVFDLTYSDLKSPEVVSSGANKSMISDSVLGSTFYYVDVEFGEKMDVSIQPLVKHEATQSLTNSLQYLPGTSAFIDSLNYRAYFQVLDENIEVNQIDLKVQYAQDASSNVQYLFVDSNFVSLDTKNPSVAGLFANTYVLDQVNDLFDVVALFDEPMLSNQPPSLMFNPLILTPTVLSLNTEAWANANTYEFGYELLSGSTQSETYDVTVNNGVDLAGNLNVPLTLSQFVRIEPVLGLNTMSISDVVIYPSILETGSRLYIEYSGGEDFKQEFQLIDVTGQSSQQVHFEMKGAKYVSEPIRVSAGMYYLVGDHGSVKIVVM